MHQTTPLPTRLLRRKQDTPDSEAMAAMPAGLATRPKGRRTGGGQTRLIAAWVALVANVVAILATRSLLGEEEGAGARAGAEALEQIAGVNTE